MKLLFPSCFLLLSILGGCAGLPDHSEILKINNKFVKIYAQNKKELDSIKESLIWLTEVNDQLGPVSKEWKESFRIDKEQARVTDMLKGVKVISLSNKNCSYNQVACAFPSDQHVIYLTKFFLKLPKQEKITTLIHENFHHHNSYEHVLCSKRKEWGVDCDNQIISAYGVEIYLWNKFALAGHATKKSKKILKLMKLHLN